VEQPLPAADDAALASIARTIPVCADESVHDRASLRSLVGRYEAVNIKLDKTGGLTEALAMAAEAERLGFSIMVALVSVPIFINVAGAADTMKAPKFPVPLTPTYAHDVKAMLKAHPSPGAYYIVNPNNPTGTMTPREDIIWLLKNKPAGSVVIVDEAYFHFSDHESVLDQVAADQDIIVLRTFSKIYGMAGIRAGYAAARPDLLAKFNTVAAPARSLASISIVSAAAVTASMQDKELVPLRRKINSDVRSETLEFLTKHNYKIVPGSQANMFMVDVKRPGREFMAQMLKENVAIGRSWPAMPNYVRVTVGTKEEMAKFQTAFVKCMDMPPGTVNGAELHMLEQHIPSELYRA